MSVTYCYVIPSPIQGEEPVILTLEPTGKVDSIGVPQWAFLLESPDGIYSYGDDDLHSRKSPDAVAVDVCAFFESYADHDRDERDERISWDADYADAYRIADRYSENFACYANATEYDSAA